MPARNLRASSTTTALHDAVTRYIDGAAIEDREFVVVAGLGNCARRITRTIDEHDTAVGLATVTRTRVAYFNRVLGRG